MVLKVTRDLQLRGRILSPSPFQFPQPPDLTKITFGGIQGEARFVPAGALGPRTLGETVTDGFHRVLLPDNVDTSFYCSIELEEWWLNDPCVVGFEYVNESAGAGAVRWRYRVRTNDIFVDTLAASTLAIDRQETLAAPNPGCIGTAAVAATPYGATFNPTPGVLASVYGVEVTRLGLGGPGNGDTLAGAVGIIGMFYGRADDDL